MGSADRFVLVSLLGDVSRWSCLLDDLLFPRGTVSGESVGRASSKGKSIVPLNVQVLDMKRELEIVVFGWASVLADSIGVPVGGARELGARASWLREHVEVVAAAAWAGDFLGELAEVARPVREVVELACGAQTARRRFVDTSRRLPVDDAVSQLQSQGFVVSRRSVYRWLASGQLLPAWDERGRITVNPLDILEFRGVAQSYPS